MNDLYAEIGYKSINHYGEQLCGDHVEIVERDESSVVAVLADGMGSGVKASIMATLTSKIISTMFSAGLPVEECVKAISETLPICSVRGVAYSTFTIIHIKNNRIAELIQYDNPQMIMIRDGEVYPYQQRELNIGGKKIYESEILLKEGDIFVAMSDGCPYAGTENKYNVNWSREDIAEFMSTISLAGYTAKVLSTMLVEECDKLYGGEPTDDVTACVVRIRKRAPVNILFGPPSERDECARMLNLFFSKEGKRIICGGTTASIVAQYLHKSIIAASGPSTDSDVPPVSKIEGVDLVTEGVLTMGKVLEYADDYTGLNEKYEDWSYGRDGASLICRMLFEEATDINFYVGKAVNPAHQNTDLPINFHIKMSIVEKLSEALKKMGKRVRTSYF